MLLNEAQAPLPLFYCVYIKLSVCFSYLKCFFQTKSIALMEHIFGFVGSKKAVNPALYTVPGAGLSVP
jgi:membrane associated rhomboid family serine protease